MAFKVKCLADVSSKMEGELTNEIVKDGLSRKYIVPEGAFDYLGMLDNLDQYNEFENYVIDSLDAAVATEQKNKYLAQIKASDVTLSQFKQSNKFEAVLEELSIDLENEGYLLNDSEIIDLFKIQPVFSEIKFENCVGALDSRVSLPFLEAIAHALS